MNHSISMADPNLQTKVRDSTGKALKHLEYSYQKVRKIPLVPTLWSEEQMEVLESFSSRFARASDIFISRYLRLKVIESDPAFRGSILDLLNFAEKHQLISSAKIWLRIRELRNVAAHEYESDDLAQLYQELIDLTPLVLAVRSVL